MKLSRSIAAVLLYGLPIAFSLAAQAQVPASVDTPASTTAKSSYILPAGWSAAAKNSVISLSPSESDLTIAIVEVGKAADGKAAAAWEAYRRIPSNSPPPRAPRNVWDEQLVIDYETSPNEHLDLRSIARRKGDSWTVLILDGSEATSEKRSGAIGQISQSLRPAGYQRETFVGKAAHPLDEARIATLVDL